MLDEKLEFVSQDHHKSKLVGGLAGGLLLTMIMAKLEVEGLQLEREGYDEEAIREIQGARLKEILNNKFGITSKKTGV